MGAEVRSWTALRGVLALWVVLFHIYPKTSSDTPALIAKGYLAVDVFFVLSGLVLARHYLERPMPAGAFLWRRFARLYPVHLVTLLVALGIFLIGPTLGFGPADPQLWDRALAHLFLIHAWGGPGSGGLNYPSWSLSAEAFAYVLFPVLALMLRHLSLVAGLIGSVLFFAAAVIAAQDLAPARDDGGLVLFRLAADGGVLRILPEFLLGMALARATTCRDRAIGFVLCLGGVAVSVLGAAIGNDFGTVLGCAALLAGLGIWQPDVPRLSHWLGLRSYALYMCHGLALIVAMPLLANAGGWEDGRVSAGLAVPVVLLISLIGAWILHRAVEVPARRWLLRKAVPGPRKAVPRFGTM